MTLTIWRSWNCVLMLGWFLGGFGCIPARPPVTKNTAAPNGTSSRRAAAAIEQDEDPSDTDLSITFVPDFLSDVGWTKLDAPLPLESVGGGGPTVWARLDSSDALLNRLTLERLGMELGRVRLEDTSLVLDERSLCSRALADAVDHARPRRLLLSVPGGLTIRAVACLAGLRAEQLYVAGCLPQGSQRETCHGEAELDALTSSDAVRPRIAGLAVDVATEAALARLAAFPTLQLLALSTRSRDAWVTLPFAVLTRLHYLDLMGWQGNLPDGGTILPLLRRLRTFRWPASLRGPVPQPCRLERVLGSLTEDGTRALAACSRLQELSSDQVEFGFTSAEPIAALRHLERLHIRHWQATQLAALAGLTELRRLSLTDSAAADFAFVAELRHLESLDLSQSKLASLDVLARVKGLQELDVGFTSVSDLSPLRSLTGLTRLWLHETQVVDILPLAALRRLKELSIARTAVGDLGPLANHPALEWVVLYESHVTDVAPLFTLPRLKRANISRLTLPAIQKQQLIQHLGLSNVDDI